MPTELEKFIALAREAKISLADMQKLVDSADFAYGRLDETVKTLTTQLAALTAEQEKYERIASAAQSRQAKIQERVSNPPAGTPTYRTEQLASQLPALDAKIAALKAQAEEFKGVAADLRAEISQAEAQKTGITNIAPDKGILSSVKALDTLLKKLNDVMSYMQEIKDMPDMGEAFQKAQTDINNISSAIKMQKGQVDAYVRALNNLKETSVSNTSIVPGSNGMVPGGTGTQPSLREIPATPVAGLLGDQGYPLLTTTPLNNIELLDKKRQELVAERSKLEQSIQHFSDGATFTDPFPPGYEDKITRLTSSIMRLDFFRNKMTGGTGGQTQAVSVTDSEAESKAVKDLELLTAKRQKLGQELMSLSSQGTTRADESGNLTTQFPPGIAERIEQITAALRDLARAESALKTAIPTQEEQVYVPDTGTQSPAEQRRMQAKKDLETLQNTYATSDKYAQERAQAQSKGFGVDTVTKITQSGLIGVEQVTHAYKDLEGVNHQLSTFIDQAGNVLPNTSRQFNTFASSVARDVVELAKWTIAIGFIYGPLRKVQEMMTKAVANEALLASAMIVLTDSSMQVKNVFDIVSTAANTVGDDVGGAIDVFTQAYRATGDLGDTYTRIATASQLMSTAMMLAKLSGMSYNESIDHLTGSLKQANLPLDQGMTLLDKWVKTSQVAQVDVSTLAIGFSVLGESADSAGMSFDQLNGLLAVIATNMGTSGAEAANAARAIVSGFESSKAIDSMNKLGIATLDTAGEARPLLDILTQISSMKQLGLINPTQYSALTLAIGGGTRRQAVVAATIQDSAKINAVAAASANATGAAQTALAKKLDTVQTATIRLNNSFQSLAETLGESGGLLDAFKFILELTNGLVKGIDALSNSIGKVAPLLMTVGGLALLFKMKPDLATSALNTVTSIVPGLYTPGSTSTGYQGRLAGAFQGQSQGLVIPPVQSNAYKFLTGGGTVASGLIGLGMSIYPAMSNFTSGKTAAGVGDLTGGIIGGVAGGLMGPVGSMIGSVIGQAIAEAFVKSTETSLDLTKYKVGSGPDYTRTAPLPSGTSPEEYVNILTKSTGAPEWLVNAVSKFTAGSQNMWNYVLGKKGTSPEEQIYNWATPTAQSEYNKRVAAARASGQLPAETGAATYFQTLQAQQAADAERALGLSSLRQNREYGLGNQLNLGQITTTDYSTKMTQIKNYTTVASGWQVALGSQFQALDKNIKDSTDLYAAFLDIMTYGSADQVLAINTVVDEIATYRNQIDALSKLKPTDLTTYTDNGIDYTVTAQARIKMLEDKLTQDYSYGGNLMVGVSGSANRAANPVPTMFGGGQVISGTPDALRQMYTLAKSMETEFLKGSKWSDNAISNYRDGLENFMIAIDEGGKTVWYSLEDFAKKVADSGDKVGSDFLQQALDKQISQGKLTIVVQSKEPSVGQANVPFSSRSELLSREEFYRNIMTSYGLNASTEPQVIVWEDGQWSQEMINAKALQFAMDSMVELQKKEIDQGIWNVPEGATIMVPVSSLTPANQVQNYNTGPYQPLPKVNPGGVADTANREIVDTTMKNIFGNVMGRGNPAVGTGQGTVPQGAMPGPSPKEAYNFFEKFYGEGGGVLGSGLKSSVETGPTLAVTLESLTSYLKLFQMSAGIGGAKGESREVSMLPKISLNMTNTTTLTLDGRVLAIAIKPYLLADIVRASAAFGQSKPTVGV